MVVVARLKIFVVKMREEIIPLLAEQAVSLFFVPEISHTPFFSHHA